MARKEIIENRKKTMPVADILRIAADERLRSGEEILNGRWYRGNKIVERYSCLAICQAIKDKIRPDISRWNIWQTKQGKTVAKFLKELGVDTKSDKLFSNFNGFDAQEVRYAWLNIAADIAEEEGLMC